MGNPIHPPCYDPDLWLDLDQDPDAPDLTDLNSPEPVPGTDIVPPAPPEATEPEAKKANGKII
jgi:hypothetical protein